MRVIEELIQSKVQVIIVTLEAISANVIRAHI